MLYEALQTAMHNKDMDAYANLLHDDFVFVRHQSGTEINKQDWLVAAKGMMASDKLEFNNSRCIYENHDIMVIHDFMTFPDGSKEAVMGVNMLKDGKIIRIETGATPLT
ncbi:MAG: nuclear transport factor 2 family protein [Gammaproteobacteria bacterium]|nr:nuclear transport factor 2 family protein [Gammaproteobacteria bacterium]